MCGISTKDACDRAFEAVYSRQRPGTGSPSRWDRRECRGSRRALPEHLREAPRLGIAFIFAFALLLAVVAALALCPEDRRIARVAALLLTGLIASYAASRVTGIPLLQPRPEAVDLVGLVTKLV